MGEVVLLRHGETEWSRDGRHTGRTDIPLTPKGEAAARAVGPALAARKVALVVASPLTRAVRTAELAGATDIRIDDDLREWDYGGYEGRTTPDIQVGRPGWYLWRDGVPPGDDEHPGETVAQVGERADRVLARIRPALDDGDVLLVGHGHTLRVLTARWLEQPPDHGRLVALDTATLSVLGHEHDLPVIRSLNVPPVTIPPHPESPPSTIPPHPESPPSTIPPHPESPPSR
jgi:broad specificity phosphatase PhoE